MATSSNLERLSRSALHDRLREVIESREWSLCVTLTSGDLLFGDFFAMDVPVTDNNADFIHIPMYWNEQTRKLGFGYRLEPFELIYNDEEGTTHGPATTILIPHDKVAAVGTTSWDIVTETGFKNIPNPYAQVISRHNHAVAQRNGLETSGYVELALSTAHVTQKGIHFTKQQLLYVDYAYFTRLPSASLSIGGIGIGAGVTRGVETVVESVLRGGPTGRLHLPTSLERHSGLIEPLPDTVSTEIEGEECFVAVLAGDVATPKRLPVLFKRTAVSYPREFWPFIKSKLIVVGETREIPLSFGDALWPECILARLIGYIP